MLKIALEAAKEQQIAQEQAWRASVEEENIEKTTQVNKLIEKVKEMEVKQSKIKHEMEQKFKNLQEQVQERYQRNVQSMQEGYKKKYEKEVQRYISARSTGSEIGTLLTGRESDDKMSSQKKALETAKQMLHQSRVESRSPVMDWDYYGTQARVQEQSIQGDRISSIEKDKDEEREVLKRAVSTPLEEGGTRETIPHLVFQHMRRDIPVKTARKDMSLLLCQCPSYGGPHLVSKCPFSGTLEGETIPMIEYN